MRVVYQTEPILVELASAAREAGDAQLSYVYFRVYALDPGEEPPAVATVEGAQWRFRRLSDLRAEVGDGQPIVAKMHPNSRFRGLLPDVISIPEAVLETLPDDTRLRFAWSWASSPTAPDL